MIAGPVTVPPVRFRRRKEKAENLKASLEISDFQKTLLKRRVLLRTRRLRAFHATNCKERSKKISLVLEGVHRA